MTTNYSSLRKGLAATALSCLSIAAFAQGAPVTTPAPAKPAAPAATTPAPTPTVLTWSGFVKADYFYDSRQTVNAREGHLLLWPSGVSRDGNGADRNAVPTFNALAIQTRLRLGITGPEFFGYKTAGAIEGEFFGHTDADINGFRLRHAFVNLTNAKVQMTFGQTWHPFFVPECFPGTYSFNTGTPFATIERNPQFRISSQGKTKVFAAILAERDFSGRLTGAADQSSAYLRNSGLPEFAAGVQHTDGGLSIGATINYKSERPSLTTIFGSATAAGGNYATTAQISDIGVAAYLKYKKGNTSIKIQNIYGSNHSDMLMLGGFGIADTVISGKIKDYKYTPIATNATWADLEWSKGTLEAGLFVAYATSLGASSDLKGIAGATGAASASPTTYGFGQTFRNMTRVAPRIGWKMGKMKIGAEIEYTAATTGVFDLTRNARKLSEVLDNAATTGFNEANDAKVNNVRVLFMAQYSF
jgi:hypothetical protein